MLNSSSIVWVVDYIGSNPLLSILSFVVAIISVIASVIFYLKSRREKSPCYNITSYNIIKDFVKMFDALEILYSGQPIRNLTVSKIVFWNAGRDTIDKDDIVKSDPITILANGSYKILDQKIIAVNNKTNNFSLIKSEDQSRVNIEFEYIDRNDGAVIQIIHTGESNNNIEIHGRIKGYGELKLTELEYLPRRYARNIFTILVTFIAAIVVYLVQYLQSNYFITNLKEESTLYGLIFAALILLSAVIAINIISKILILSKLPKGLENFKEDITRRDIKERNVKKVSHFNRKTF